MDIKEIKEWLGGLDGQKEQAVHGHALLWIVEQLEQVSSMPSLDGSVTDGKLENCKCDILRLPHPYSDHLPAEVNETCDVEVTVPADLSASGQEQRRIKPIDKPIADIVEALADAGIVMRSSCSGHGKCPGEILFNDGRKLIIEGL